MTTVPVGIMQPPSAEWPEHWSFKVGQKGEPFLHCRRGAPSFTTDATTISVRLPFYIAYKRDLQRARCVKMSGNRSFKTVSPFKKWYAMVTVAWAKLQTVCRWQYDDSVSALPLSFLTHQVLPSLQLHLWRLHVSTKPQSRSLHEDVFVDSSVQGRCP